MPHVGQWVAPTLEPAELDKRIDELRTVQFWLEQNARMLAATIQALEVQRMTLSTLQTMNVSFGDLTESLKIKLPEARPPAPAPDAKAAPPPRQTKAGAPAALAAAGIIDPMQWWGALTQQFTELATNAIKDGGAGAARNFAGAMPPHGAAGAEQTLKTAAETAKPAAGAAAKTAKTAKRGRGGSARG